MAKEHLSPGVVDYNLVDAVRYQMLGIPYGGAEHVEHGVESPTQIEPLLGKCAMRDTDS